MIDKFYLMSTRLKMPQPRKNYIIRDKLFSKLNKINEYSVVLVKGGAGTGKTTLITSFVKEKQLSNVKWISLDESCNNVFLFWNYLIEGIGDYLGNTKQNFLSLFDSNFQKSNINQLITILINKLDNEEELFICLDDFYYITDEFLLKTIEYFISNIPNNVHIILITRYEPKLYLAGLNMAGKLIILGDETLKLSVEDGKHFLSNTLKLNYEAETLDYICSLSEGWIGGLQLLAAVANEKNDTEIKKLRFENGLLTEYLNREIFEVLNKEEKEFLIITSVLNYFNEDICNRLFEAIEFKKMMRDLLEKNFLITCIDEEKQLYRYHNILKEYLISRFKEKPREVQIKSHLKTSELLKELGDYNQCIYQLLMAEEYDVAMRLILELPKNSELFSYVDKVPEEYITRNADFAYQSYFYYYVNSEFEKCRELYDLFSYNMEQNSTFSAFKFSNLFVEDTFKLNDIDAMPIAEVEKLPLIDTTKAYILIKDAAFLYVQSRYEQALNCIDKAMSYSVSNSNFYILFFSYSIKAQVLEDMGELNKCTELYIEMKKILDANEKHSMLISSYYIGITGMQLKQLQLDKAKGSLTSAVQYVTEDSISSYRGYKYNYTEYKYLIGETENALELTKELLKMETYNNPIYLAAVLRYSFRITKFPEEEVHLFIKGYESIEEKYRSFDSKLLYCDILFNNGETQEAMELTDQILKYSRKDNIKLKLVQASLLKIAMIFNTKGKKREVLNLFREAIFYSKEDRILQPYFMEKEIVAKIIEQYEAEFYNELSSAEKIHYKEISSICKVQAKAILSEREIDVLKQIASGASNKEIAERLCISLATVKTHIINIYSKLQVNNRVSSIEEAKKYGII